MPAALDGSPTRDARAILRTLTAAPLRLLTANQLGPYAAWAMTTVGSAADYRHFHPRILELAIDLNSWHGLEPWLIAGKLVYAKWHEWPAPQQEAVTAVFLAGFDYSLEAAPDQTHEPADWLAGVARLGLPLERPLAGWRDAIARNPLSRLSLFVTQWAEAITDGSSAPPYWQDVDATLVVQVRNWLFSTATRAQLQQYAGEREIDEALAALRGPDRFELH